MEIERKDIKRMNDHTAPSVTSRRRTLNRSCGHRSSLIEEALEAAGVVIQRRVAARMIDLPPDFWTTDSWKILI